MPSKEIAEFAGADIAQRLSTGPESALVDRTLDWLSGANRFLLTLGEAAYPKQLAAIHDPPMVLYAQGDPALLNTPCIAIVGSRNATPQGVRDAHDFALALSGAGYAIASGMALGIDAAAHRGGLAGRGSSIAVVGTGADVVYPSRNRGLAQELAERGCLISEFPLGTPAAPGNFPRRNRLISGLALAVVVVEAARRSGSLITVRFALEQGRDVFAIPGSIHSPLSKGCHDLIKQGAALVESAADVLLEIEGPRRAVPAEAPEANPPAPHPLLDLMGFAPVTVDQLAQRTGLGAGALSAQLSQLEIAGRVSILPGGWFQRFERIE